LDSIHTVLYGWTVPGGGLPARCCPTIWVHWIVESHLGLPDGFWGLIAQGVDLGAVNAAGHSPGGQRLSERDTTELRQAEMLVNAVGPDPPGVNRSPGERLIELEARCRTNDVPVPEIDEEVIARLAAEVAAYDARWRSLPGGGALNVEFTLPSGAEA
jgi:hypothetical protein